MINPNQAYTYTKSESKSISDEAKDDQFLHLLIDIKSEVVKLKNWITLINKKIEVNKKEIEESKRTEINQMTNITEFSKTLFTLSDAFDKLALKLNDLNQRVNKIESLLNTTNNINATNNAQQTSVMSKSTENKEQNSNMVDEFKEQKGNKINEEEIEKSDRELENALNLHKKAYENESDNRDSDSNNKIKKIKEKDIKKYIEELKQDFDLNQQ
ncbi:MAG: hypothetical protein GWP09_01490 [Nitrospiraceae bacterium]|nr:hypothetical protein [Nitrospiraceae bacterium]